MPSLSSTELFHVNGLVAVITGGGTGIGLMMAKALEENGAKVYIVGRRIEVLNKAAQEAVHGNIIPLQGDVTSKMDLLRIAGSVEAADGFINVLVVNSGILGPINEDLPPPASLSTLRERLWETDQKEFCQVFDINVSGAFFTITAFLDLLHKGNEKGNIEQKSQVIATSSIGGFQRTVLGYAYQSSKAAMTHLMKQFATSLVPYQIRSNTIAPGYYPSEMSGSALEAIEALGGMPQSLVPLQRPGTVEDMAGAILFLTSRAGAYLNGNVLITDGGRLGIVPSTY